MAMPSLFDHDDTPGSIAERFATFHATNPEVYVELVRLARELVEAGRTRVGIGMLWEVMRWHYALDAEDPTAEFKLNDHYRSRYARLIMRQEADLEDIFELRDLRAE